MFKFIQIATGIELSCDVNIGRYSIIDHFGGSGCAWFGNNCRIRNGVTAGLRRVEEPAAPTISPVLVGSITVGDNCVIGANAIVLQDVPADSIAIGVPALVMPRRQAGGGIDWS